VLRINTRDLLSPACFSSFPWSSLKSNWNCFRLAQYPLVHFLLAEGIIDIVSAPGIRERVIQRRMCTPVGYPVPIRRRSCWAHAGAVAANYRSHLVIHMSMHYWSSIQRAEMTRQMCCRAHSCGYSLTVASTPRGSRCMIGALVARTPIKQVVIQLCRSHRGVRVVPPSVSPCSGCPDLPFS
jgi:hypothetical protein